MAMFPQFFSPSTLYPNLFRGANGLPSMVPGSIPPSVPSQPASPAEQAAVLLSNGALESAALSSSSPFSFNAQMAAAHFFANAHNSPFFVDGLLRAQAAAALALGQPDSAQQALSCDYPASSSQPCDRKACSNDLCRRARSRADNSGPEDSEEHDDSE